MEFPASLYKPGTQFEWDGEMFDTLVVHDEEEVEIALADGWSIGKPGKAAKPEPKDEPAEEAKDGASAGQRKK